MAIEIIKQGQTKFTAHCYKCGCEFTYEMEDVVDNMIMCPCCGNHIVHMDLTGIIKYPYIPHVDDHSNLNTQLSMSPKTCEECGFYRKYLAGGKTCIGDSPCQWCQNSPYRVSCVTATTAFEK